MSVLRWFRRTRPTAPTRPRLSVSEAIIITRSGHTEQSWAALTNQERANIRWRVGA